MTYQDNDFYISLKNGYSIVDGSFCINKFSITDGQDPDNEIKNGLIVPVSSDGKITFKIGRKGSKEVATWYNESISASKTDTTFNENPDKLNFALIGNLKLTITGGVLRNKKETFTFSDIVLAQKSTGTLISSNEWSFSGTNCYFDEKKQFNAKAINNSFGYTVSFLIKKEGSSKINVIPPFGLLLDTGSWMKYLPDSVSLNQIVIPGSHDAGLSELSNCNPVSGTSVEGKTKTQSGSVGQQLLDGSRYLDIRVDYDHGELVTYHRGDGTVQGYLGCNGQSLKSILDQTKNFLNTHLTETVFVKFSHIRDFPGHVPADTKEKIDKLLKGYESSIYKNDSTNINLANIPLKEVRGKMILVFDYPEYIDSVQGRFRYNDYNQASPATNITVFDKYANTSDFEKMKEDQLKKWKEKGGLGKDYLFLLSWTLTFSSFWDNLKVMSSIENSAISANEKLIDTLYEQIEVHNFERPNIIYVDFLEKVVTQGIILYNFKDTLYTLETLKAGNHLISANKNYILRMQEDDGNLCVYKFEDGKQSDFIWGAMEKNNFTPFKNAVLKLQSSGNLVVLDEGGNQKWESKTIISLDRNVEEIRGKLVLENDGSLKLYDPSGNIVWKSN